MAYRRRRGFKGTWFPAFGEELLDGDLELVGLSGQLRLDNQQGATNETIALLPDLPVEDDNDASKSLADSIGSEYALRRIVGKIVYVFDGILDSPLQRYVKVTTGLFIARADVVNPDIPVGAQGSVVGADAEEATFDAYGAAALAAQRQPWIWRRSWVLQYGVPFTPGNYVVFPCSNTQYGSVMDGPHVDAKTRRRVRGDERLFLSHSLTYFPPDASDEGGPAGSALVSYNIDLRYFGALRRAKDKGAF